MTTAQMAVRLGVSQPRIITLEQDEVRGVLSLETLSRAAQALDCTVVYALVPNQSFDHMVRRRADQIAAARIGRVDHSMRLENQGLSKQDGQAEHRRVATELLQGNLRRIWDEPA